MTEETKAPNTQHRDGRVIGHVLNFNPGYTKQKVSKVIITKPPILGATIRVLFDDNTVADVPVRDVERVLEAGDTPTDEAMQEVHKEVVNHHPLLSKKRVRSTSEPSRKYPGRLFMRHNLVS